MLVPRQYPGSFWEFRGTAPGPVLGPRCEFCIYEKLGSGCIVYEELAPRLLCRIIILYESTTIWAAPSRISIGLFWVPRASFRYTTVQDLGPKTAPARKKIVEQNDESADVRIPARLGRICQFWATTQDPGRTLHSRAQHKDDVS